MGIQAISSIFLNVATLIFKSEYKRNKSVGSLSVKGGLLNE